MIVHQVFAQIQEETVQNVMVCDNYELANYLTRCTYGEEAFAVDCLQYPCQPGDKYRNGRFYHTDQESGEETEVSYVPTAEDQVKTLIYEMEPIRMAASFSAAAFTDAQALQVPDLYPEWNSAGTSYQPGERLRYQGILYKVLQAHTSQESWTPTAAPSLFAKVLIPDPEVIPDWEQPDSTNGYSKGDRVKHKGKTWESLTDNNVWEPGVVGTESLWKEIEKG